MYDRANFPQLKALGSYEGEAWVFGDAKEVRHLAMITWRGYMLSLLGCPGQDSCANGQ